MNDSSDDELQILKRWWDENGTSLVLTVCVALAGITGWNWWQNSQAAKMEQSFSAFNQLVNELDAAQSSGDEIQIAQADYVAQQIKDDYPASYYASFAAFLKAKQAVDDQDFEAATKELQWVIEQNPSEELVLVAKYRLAKTHFASNDFESALTVLDVAEEGSFSMAYGELRGDIYLSQQKYAEAADAYSKALSAVEASELRASPLLEEKIAYSNSFL